MHAVEGVGGVLQERPVVNAPLPVIVAIVGVFDAPEIILETGSVREFVKTLNAVVASVHENGVVAVPLQVLAKGVEVVFGVRRPHEIVVHHGRNACQYGRQHFKAAAAVRHAVERKALAEKRIEEGCEGEAAVVAVVTDHFLPDVFQDDDDQIVRNTVDAQGVAFDETVR